jgi:hypothetical protein
VLAGKSVKKSAEKSAGKSVGKSAGKLVKRLYLNNKDNMVVKKLL